jgi:diguanylate cyclase (GGDEF)-like protein
VRIYIYLFGLFSVVLAALFAATYFFIHLSYLEIEDSHNSRIQDSIIHSLEKHLDNLKTSVYDYAQWDDTDDFVRGLNEDYLDDNFRENSNTLENLNISAFQFLDKYETPIVLLPQDSPLGKELLLLKNNKLGGFFVWNGELYSYFNAPITNTDATIAPSGLLQGVSKVSLRSLSLENKEIESIDWVFNVSALNEKNIKIGDTKIKLHALKKPEIIENYILFEETVAGKMAGIKTIHPRTIYLQGKKTTKMYLIIMVGMLTLVACLMLLRHKEIAKEKTRLEETVQKRTSDLKSTMSELEQAVKKLESIAYVDELTGVRTRRSFFEASTLWLENAIKNKNFFCIAMMDLDDFKIINDTYGHEAGDMVLKDFCRSCEKHLDERMILGRLGGEEFVIGFYGLSSKSAERICEKIQDFIGQRLVSVAPHAKVSYTFSFGIACNSEALDVDGILRLADERLYGAKERGKNLIRSR